MSDFFSYLQVACILAALLLNALLIYIVIKYTKSGIGSYKYMLISFAVFEMVYAVIILIGMPINYMADKSWIVFNFNGPIAQTSYNWLGPALYCTFYYLWMGLVVVHFIYRYIVVCRDDLKQKIEDHLRWKMVFVAIYAIHVIYAIICGFYICRLSEMSKKLQKDIRNVFGVEKPERMGFILLRLKHLDGKWNSGGIISILNHYILVLISVIIINFCGFHLWKTIGLMQKTALRKEANLERQMFTTLILQTTIPFFFLHLPTLVYLVGTSPFVSENFSFGASSSFFALMIVIPKMLDPIVVLCCIKEYRKSTRRIFGFKSGSLETVMVCTSDGSGTYRAMTERRGIRL